MSIIMSLEPANCRHRRPEKLAASDLPAIAILRRLISEAFPAEVGGARPC